MTFRHYLLFFFFFSILYPVLAQSSYGPPDKGSFLLHKFQQNLGKETYTVTRKDSVITYEVDFKFVDRGTPVPLKTTVSMSGAQEPLGLYTKGKTSRMSTIDDSITIRGHRAEIRVDDSVYSVPAGDNVFPVAGYSPTTVQMLLLRYWNQHGRPAVIHTLPGGDVGIREGGVDRFTLDGKDIVLNWYVISGLVWGNELLWADDAGQVYCMLTNDAEGDKLEAMLEPYEALLPEIIDKAAIYGMQLFGSQVKPDAAEYHHIAIRNANLADVETGRNIPGTTILIEDGKIKAVGPNIGLPADAYTIDAKGKTVLPGLWDMHAHFEQVEWGPAYLAAGVTTVRDCGNEMAYIDAVQKAIDEGAGIGPRILKAGIIDGKGPMALGIIQASTPEEAIKAVQNYKNNGFVQIKIYSSVTPEIVKVICDEAHRVGLTVTGHIPNGMDIRKGIAAGMDMVNHVQYVNSALRHGKDMSVDFTDSANARLLDLIFSHGTVIDPTLSVFEWIFRNTADPVTDIEPAFYSIPKPLQALFANTGMPAKQAEKYKVVMKTIEYEVVAMYKRGIPIVAGTDMGIPGYSLYRELELYVDGGLTPAQALQTATLIPARVMKRDGFSGTVTPGKDADLIIVDGDPLGKIQDLRKLKTVIKGGKIYDPVALHRMVGFN